LDPARIGGGGGGGGGTTTKSVVPGFVLIRKSVIPIPRIGDERRRTEQEDERDREEERKWRPGG